MREKFLHGMYEDGGPTDVKSSYDAWAATYEAEIAENGYATPGRCAVALAKFLPDTSLKVLDVGCGTGLSGLALRTAGFSNIDGMDISAEMLAKAREKQIYANIHHIDIGTFPVETGAYAAISAVGLLGPGHAPPDLIDQVMNALASGGKFVFSLNDVAVKDRIYEARLNEYLDFGSARLLFREHGAHLPGHNLKSIVYVVEKA